MVKPFKILLTFVIAAGVLAMCSIKPRLQLPDPIVVRSVPNVGGFELRHTGFGASGTGAFQPHFSLDDALSANYAFVIYRDRIYRHAGPGSVVVRPRANNATPYLVEEIADRPDEKSKGMSSLSIRERGQRGLLGIRYLESGQVEEESGAVGQHAMAFVRKVLLTQAPAGIQPYGTAPVTQTPLRAGTGDPPLQGGDGCPPAYRIFKADTPHQFDAGAWAFRPRRNVDSFACTDNFIVVESGDGARLLLDLLDADGTHLFQSAVALPFDERANVTVQRLRVNGERLQVDLHVHPGKHPDGKPRARQRLRLAISMAPPEPAPEPAVPEPSALPDAEQ